MTDSEKRRSSGRVSIPVNLQYPKEYLTGYLKKKLSSEDIKVSKIKKSPNSSRSRSTLRNSNSKAKPVSKTASLNDEKGSERKASSKINKTHSLILTKKKPTKSRQQEKGKTKCSTSLNKGQQEKGKTKRSTSLNKGQQEKGKTKRSTSLNKETRELRSGDQNSQTSVADYEDTSIRDYSGQVPSGLQSNQGLDSTAVTTKRRIRKRNLVKQFRSKPVSTKTKSVRTKSKKREEEEMDIEPLVTDFGWLKPIETTDEENEEKIKEQIKKFSKNYRNLMMTLGF